MNTDSKNSFARISRINANSTLQSEIRENARNLREAFIRVYPCLSVVKFL